MSEPHMSGPSRLPIVCYFGRRYLIGLDVELRTRARKQMLLLAIFIMHDNIVKLHFEVL